MRFHGLHHTDPRGPARYHTQITAIPHCKKVVPKGTDVADVVYKKLTLCCAFFCWEGVGVLPKMKFFLRKLTFVIEASVIVMSYRTDPCGWTSRSESYWIIV